MPSSPTLPPLVETFPEDKYPLREVGQGFTAQSCQGEEAQACAAIAAEMLDESRTVQVSQSSVNSDSLDASGAETFPVADLPLPDGAVEVGDVLVFARRLALCTWLYLLRPERSLDGERGMRTKKPRTQEMSPPAICAAATKHKMCHAVSSAYQRAYVAIYCSSSDRWIPSCVGCVNQGRHVR